MPAPANVSLLSSTLNQWIVCDFLGDVQASAPGQEPDALRLLRIGDVDFSSAHRSARNGWGPLHSRFTSAPIRRALREGRDQEGSGEFDGQLFRFRVTLCRDRAGEVVGLLAIHHSADQEPPRAPAYGSFRLTLLRDNGLAASAEERHWPDQALEGLKLSTEQVKNDRGETGYWLANMLHPDDRARIWESITAGARAANGKRQILAFRSKGDPDPAAPYFPHLLSAYGVPAVGRESTHVLIRGFWLQLSHETRSHTVGISPTGATVMLAGILELEASKIYAWFDVAQRKTVAVSPSWTAAGLPAGYDGDIVGLASGQDREKLRTLLHSARTSSRSFEHLLVIDELGRCKVKVALCKTHDRAERLVAVAFERNPE